MIILKNLITGVVKESDSKSIIVTPKGTIKIDYPNLNKNQKVVLGKDVRGNYVLVETEISNKTKTNNIEFYKTKKEPSLLPLNHLYLYSDEHNVPIFDFNEQKVVKEMYGGVIGFKYGSHYFTNRYILDESFNVVYDAAVDPSDPYDYLVYLYNFRGHPIQSNKYILIGGNKLFNKDTLELVYEYDYILNDYLIDDENDSLFFLWGGRLDYVKKDSNGNFTLIDENVGCDAGSYIEHIKKHGDYMYTLSERVDITVQKFWIENGHLNYICNSIPNSVFTNSSFCDFTGDSKILKITDDYIIIKVTFTEDTLLEKPAVLLKLDANTLDILDKREFRISNGSVIIDYIEDLDLFIKMNHTFSIYNDWSTDTVYTDFVSIYADYTFSDIDIGSINFDTFETNLNSVSYESGQYEYCQFIYPYNSELYLLFYNINYSYGIDFTRIKVSKISDGKIITISEHEFNLSHLHGYYSYYMYYVPCVPLDMPFKYKIPQYYIGAY